MRPEKFSAQMIADELDMSKQFTYQHIRDLVQFGLVEKVKQAEWPEDAWDWSTRRRRTFRKEKGITRISYYVYNPKGVLKYIEMKVEELLELREKLVGVVYEFDMQ